VIRCFAAQRLEALRTEPLRIFGVFGVLLVFVFVFVVAISPPLGSVVSKGTRGTVDEGAALTNRLGSSRSSRLPSPVSS
jgi:hypothetical protein